LVVVHENAITDELLHCLRQLTPAGQRRVVSRALGVVGISSSAGLDEIRGRTPWLDGRRSRRPGAGASADELQAVLVTIAGDVPRPGRDRRTSPGGEVDAALLWRGELVVLLEVKKPGNPPSPAQLVRHAGTWGIPCDGLEAWMDPDHPPAGFGFVSWTALLAGLGELAAGRALIDADRARVRDLVETLNGALASVGPARHERPARAVPVPVIPLADPVDLDALLAGLDPIVVAAACDRLYGPAGTHAVGDGDCVADATALIRSHLAEGLSVPPGFYDVDDHGVVSNVMTPRRMLTCAYQGRFLGTLGGDRTPARVLRDRLIRRGADRATLIGLWAWTSTPDTGRAAGRRRAKLKCAQVLPHPWPRRRRFRSRLPSSRRPRT
jgi:hypothetical protein